MASYIDAGSIVAGAAGLALWADEFGFGSGTVGLIAAFSSNAISAGVGALAGGWLADKIGRKPVYQWDLLLYAFGVLWIVLAVQPWMLVFGYVFVGLAVGADVPASWTLLAEQAPDGKRGRHAGTAQLLWGLGPAVVLLLAFALADLGVLGIRIVFAHLLVVSLVLFALRRRLAESHRWERAIETAPHRSLRTRRYVAPLLLIGGMYGIWNLKAGTSGFFFPYILQTVGDQTQAHAVALQSFGFILGAIGTVVIFMRIVDHTAPRTLFAAGLGFQLLGMLVIAICPLTTGFALVYVICSGLGGGFGPQAFFQLWSAEAFPTTIRSTALGLMFAVVRIALGIWSLFVPALTEAGFTTLAWLLVSFLVVSGVLGLIFAPARPGTPLTS